MIPKQRKILLFALLAGVVLLAWFAPEPADQRVQPRVAAVTSKDSAPGNAAAPARSAAREPAIVPELPQRGALDKPKHEIFGFQTWQPPPPPPPKVVVTAPSPPPPVAPPNPYRFAGRILRDGQTQVFLTRGEYPVLIKEGDVLEGEYRVESISSASISLTYIPLGTRDVVAVPPAGTDTGTSGLPSPRVVPFAIPKPLVLSPR